MSKVTQEMLAQRLGLSRNCVSKALNGSNGISPTTRELVLQTAREMGYGIRTAMLMEQEGKPQRLICLLARGNYLLNSYWTSFLQGVEKGLKQRGFGLLLRMVDQDESLDDLRSNAAVAGVVILWNHSRSWLRQIRQMNLPVICVDLSTQEDEHEACDAVFSNNEQMMRQLTAHLIGMGHTRIGFIGNPDSSRSFYERWLGFFTAMRRAGLPVDEQLCLYGGSAQLYDRESFAVLMASCRTLPTAYMCANDYIAMNLMKILHDRGVRVPRDVSVTGFDNIPEATLMTPELTTVDGHVHDLGGLASELILWRIENPAARCREMRLQSDLCLRGSTAAPLTAERR